MKKNYLLLIMLFVGFLANAQVTQIYTDYNGFWTSSNISGETVSNTVRPNLQHNLLAFKIGTTVYSTGVNNGKLTENGVTGFLNTKFRALPILSVPLTGGTSYFRGIGALADGTSATAVTGSLPAITTGEQKALMLTDGIQGLGLGSGLANIPTTTLEFNLSTKGITVANIGDGVPDILVSQIATPDGTLDKMYFVDNNNVRVGIELLINMSDSNPQPTVGNWLVDFFNNNGTAAAGAFTNTERVIKFFAADLSQFGITTANAGSARKLVYVPGGTSDPAFLAFNEPSVGVAAKLAVATQPTTSNCDGTMPSNFTVKLQDAFGFDVPQAGYTITASMYSGPGQLLGTLTAVTDATGVATFSALQFEVGGDHRIQFNSSSLDSGITANIAGPTNCASNVWTGATNTNWNVGTNWQTGAVPNANNNVTIPAGAPRYPVLTANAGAKDLVMGAGATINLNGKLFTIKGNITKDASTTTNISGATTGSELYMSGTAAQTIPASFINGNLYNFTSDNPAGVTTNATMFVTNVVKVNSGNFATNNNLTLVCEFAPHKTAQIGVMGGTISGNVTTEQCYPARRAYRLLTSAVTTATSIHANWQENAIGWSNNPNPGYGTHITGTTSDQTNGFDFQPSGAASMFTFNNATQVWAGIANTDVNKLTAGTPYRLMIRGSRSTDITKNAATPSNTKLRATGTIVQGTVNVGGLSATAGNVSFVGNPYQSIVDMGKVMGAATNLGNFYTVWDPQVGGSPTVGQPGGRGGYVTIQAASGVSNNTTSSAATKYLQPNQAFFVTSTGGTPVLTFNETDKAPDGGHTYVYRTANQSNIDLALYTQDAYDSHATASDALKVMFDGGYSNDVDANDANKFTNLDENLARANNDVKLAIESRNQPVDGEELPLSLTQYRYNSYVFVATVGNFDGIDVFLKDNYLNKTTRLNQNAETAVPFTKDDANVASVAATRFTLLFKQAALGTNTPIAVTKGFTVYPNPANSELYINADADYASAKVAVYNTLGQQVLSTNQNFSANKQLKLNVSALQAGMYVVKVVTNSGAEFTAKLIKE